MGYVESIEETERNKKKGKDIHHIMFADGDRMDIQGRFLRQLGPPGDELHCLARGLIRLNEKITGCSPLVFSHFLRGFFATPAYYYTRTFFRVFYTNMNVYEVRIAFRV